MNCICTIHTDYVEPSKKEEILRNVTKIITEALLTRDREGNHGEGNVNQ